MMQHRFSWSLLISVLIASSDIGNAEIVTGPRNAAIQHGGSVYFNCASSLAQEIHWFHYPIGSTEGYIVYGYDKFHTPYEGKFQLEKNGSAYKLIIPSAEFDQAGKYECRDDNGGGGRKSAQLTVWGHEPICQSDKKIDNIIGRNICGIEPDVLVLTCSIQYSGKEEPMLEWRNLTTNDVINKGTSVGNQDNLVTLNLTLNEDLFINGSSYLCQTRNSTISNYSCIIGPVRVLGKSAATLKSSGVGAIICALVVLIRFMIG